ncbi:MAG: hypothetical protein LIP23_05875 [Planctomycetes bacterium]|nr:hypothetical protein [Planctomycetota bacterium]
MAGAYSSYPGKAPVTQNIIVEYLSIAFILTNFLLLASSRLGMCIKAVAAQGITLALIPVVHEWGHLTTATLAVSLITLVVKGYAFPILLHKAAGRAGVGRELEPLVSYNLSLISGMAMLLFAFWLQSRLPSTDAAQGLLIPAAFFAILAGFFITIARRKALTQVLGYLALENGIFAFGAAALAQHPWLLELGVLLDLFAGVFIMGIAIFHISREFSHMDADRLAALRDPTGGPEA